MKRPLLIFVCFCLMLAPGCQLSEQQEGNSPGVTTILLKLSTGVLSEKTYAHAIDEIKNSDLQQVLRKFEIAGIRSVFKNRYNDQGKLKNDTIQSHRSLLSGWFEVTVSNRFNSKEFIAMLRQHKYVMDAVEDTPMRLQPDIAPNDAGYSSQWHLNNPANPNFDIDAEAAWNINRGRNDVIIAVLDGGVDYNHPDLDPGNRSRVIAGIDTGDGDNDPMDNLPDDAENSYAGHGTNIAGVIGARTDNGQQVAGVMWNCSIMPVKMVRSGGIRIPHIVDWDWSESAFPSDVADAIDYAVGHGAHVINLSYSFPDMGWPINDVVLRIPLLADALNNAYQNNVVVTASMGNEYARDNSVRYPAGFNEHVIAVGATSPSGIRSNFSNTGMHIDLAAPGSGIWTTERGGGTDAVSGTSFSAPMVAGVAGLVISQGKDRNFNLTNEDVRHILELTVTDVTQYGTGFDEQTGHGIVNAHRALQLIDEPNVLFHYNSMGGTSTKVASEIGWLLLSNRWGIAAAAYYKVDQYKITKHITFDVPFCAPPTVWLRERESKCLSYANPNDGRPYAIITNITNTGFDVEYVTYYVRYNVSAQEINKWIPAAPAATNVAYTAVGIPVPTISGPSLVCSSNTSFTVSDLYPGSSATWTATPASLFVTSSGTGTQANLRAASGRRGQGILKFSVTTKCGVPVEVTKTVEVGAPELDATYSNGSLLTFTAPGTPANYNLVCNLESKTVQMTLSTGTGTWQRIAASPNNTLWSTTGNNLNFYFYQANQTATFRFTATNACGTISQDYSFKSKTCGSGGCPQYTVTPNPSSDKISIVVPNIPPPCAGTSSVSNDMAFSKTEKSENKLVIRSVVLYGTDGLTKVSRQFISNTKTTEIDISDFQQGTYILKISDGVYEETHRILKQ